MIQRSRNDNEQILGQFEHEVLMAIFRLGSDAYTVTVKDELRERIGKDSPLGAISVTLSRLEKRGLLASARGAPSQGRRGRPRRLYDLTKRGAAALNRGHERHLKLWKGVDQVVAPGSALPDSKSNE